MYLAWGVNPYPADGWAVVGNYGLASYKAKYNPNGPALVVVDNGTPQAVPQPGDVVSIARSEANPYGHTAVVTGNAVDSHGDGTITVIQQNGGAGNNGWASYPVNHWLVGDGVSAWLHNPSWSFQRPLVGYGGADGFEARIVAPGDPYETVSPGGGSIAVAGDTGALGSNGDAIYGYVDQDGDFYARRVGSPSWTLVATHAKSIAVAMTGSGTPVLAYLSSSGDFYAEQGALNNPFVLQAQGVRSIALAGGSGGTAPLLGYLESANGAFLTKSGVAGDSWTIEQPRDVQSIALAEGNNPSSGLLGYVSTNGTFFVKHASQAQWSEQATAVSAISLALVGPSNEPLVGYLSGSDFFATETLASTGWLEEASGVAQMAVSSGSAEGALPVLGYVTTAGDLEVLQGPLSGKFTLQADDASSLALSAITDT
jgi:hypothetical protein